MIRTVVSLDEADKPWLDQQAALQQVSMTEVVRQALHAFRAARERNNNDFSALLDDTSGLWTEGDGLDWQQKMRSEWDT